MKVEEIGTAPRLDNIAADDVAGEDLLAGELDDAETMVDELEIVETWVATAAEDRIELGLEIQGRSSRTPLWLCMLLLPLNLLGYCRHTAHMLLYTCSMAEYSYRPCNQAHHPWCTHNHRRRWSSCIYSSKRFPRQFQGSCKAGLSTDWRRLRETHLLDRRLLLQMLACIGRPWCS